MPVRAQIKISSKAQSAGAKALESKAKGKKTGKKGKTVSFSRVLAGRLLKTDKAKVSLRLFGLIGAPAKPSAPTRPPSARALLQGFDPKRSQENPARKKSPVERMASKVKTDKAPLSGVTVLPGIHVKPATNAAGQTADLSEKSVVRLELSENAKSAVKVKSARAAPPLVVIDLRQNPLGRQMSMGGDMLPQGSSLVPGDSTAVRENVSVATMRTPVSDGSSAKTAPTLKTFQELMIPEVVQRAGIILKSNDQGEIRLVLKPENLGSVRIRLQLNESGIAGRIVVENNTVRELFEGSLDNLRSALRQEGFQTTLEVAVGQGQTKDRQADQSWNRQKAVAKIDHSIPDLVRFGDDQLLVNVVV